MFKIDLVLDTTMWNEGFEQAEYPWLRLYTDNAQWVNNLPHSFSVIIHHEPFPQNFLVKVDEINGSPLLPEYDQIEWEDADNDHYQYEVADGQKRFSGILLGATVAELNAIVEHRLNYWTGI